jgi:hypothetical protein
MSSPSTYEEVEGGSWIPMIVILAGITMWWIAYSPSPTALRIRRFYNAKRLHWKKKLGLRDESIYKNGTAGDGANQKHKRQG